MRKLSKTFLVLSVAAFLAGFTDAGSELGWGILKPLSAIFFILFFITNLLTKEIIRFDQEERVRIIVANPLVAGSSSEANPSSVSTAHRSDSKAKKGPKLATAG